MAPGGLPGRARGLPERGRRAAWAAAARPARRLAHRHHLVHEVAGDEARSRPKPAKSRLSLVRSSLSSRAARSARRSSFPGGLPGWRGRWRSTCRSAVRSRGPPSPGRRCRSRGRNRRARAAGGRPCRSRGTIPRRPVDAIAARHQRAVQAQLPGARPGSAAGCVTRHVPEIGSVGVTGRPASPSRKPMRRSRSSMRRSCQLHAVRRDLGGGPSRDELRWIPSRVPSAMEVPARAWSSRPATWPARSRARCSTARASAVGRQVEGQELALQAQVGLDLKDRRAAASPAPGRSQGPRPAGMRAIRQADRHGAGRRIMGGHSVKKKAARGGRPSEDVSWRASARLGALPLLQAGVSARSTSSSASRSPMP